MKFLSGLTIGLLLAISGSTYSHSPCNDWGYTPPACGHIWIDDPNTGGGRYVWHCP